VSGNDVITIRVSPGTLILYLVAAWTTGAIVAVVVFALSARTQPQASTIGGVIAGTIVMLPAFRLRARFSSTGIDARNAFRSFQARWEDVAAIRIIAPGTWYSLEWSWASRMLEVETRDGQRFPLRCCTHIRRRTVEKLSAVLQQRAREYGFDVPSSLRVLSRMRWSDAFSTHYD